MVKRGKFKNDDLSNKVVFILAIMVVLIVATSTWMVLTKLSTMDAGSMQGKTITVTKVIEQGPPTGGAIGLSITEPETEVSQDG